MKKIFYSILFLTLFNTVIFSQIPPTEESDNSKTSASSKIAFVDQLDSLLSEWFYYTGRDTIQFLKPADRNNFLLSNIPDSLFAMRIRNIPTTIHLTYNSHVKKYIERYVINGKWIAPKFLGLSHQYFPMFEEKLDAYDLPLELKYLPVIESALNPKAKSPAGAVGLWQIMYKTGIGLGLEINTYVDERMDPEKSTEAACVYLKKLYETYQDWNIVLAAYNAGPGTVNNAIRRSGGKTTYWEILPYLPNETRNYVPAFISIVYLFTYADKHGFKPEYIPFIEDADTVMITKQLHFAALDSILEIPIGHLRELNPQYKKDIVPAINKEYPLKIQRKYITKFIELEDSIYRYCDSVFFNSVKIEIKPDDKVSEYIPSAAQPVGTVQLNYTVKSGDAIGLIASWYGVNTADLKAWNGLSSNNIRVGQVLKVYVPAALESKYKVVNSLSFEEKQKMIGINPNTNTPKDEPLDPNWEYYTVKSGDTPFSISKKFPGVSVDDILKNNNISDPSSLRIGQNLKIRKKQ